MKLLNAQKSALAILAGYNTQNTKLVALHNKIADQSKLGEAERVFLSEVLTSNPVEHLKRNEDRLTRNYWVKLAKELKFSEHAPMRLCGDFFITAEGVTEFNETNILAVLDEVFNQDKSKLLASIHSELEKWSIGTQKQGKYRFVLSDLPMAHTKFIFADNLLFPLFQYLSESMEEVIDWRSKCASGDYTDLMMVFSGLIEIKLHKRGAISVEFSKRLNPLLENGIVDPTALIAA